MATIFSITIDTRTAAFGEPRKDQEREALAEALVKIAGNVGSGAPLITAVLDRNGAQIGTCAWGAGAVNP